MPKRFAQYRCLLFRDSHCKNRKFLATIARDQQFIVGSKRLQHLTDIDQYAVTKLVPIMIIDCFEMIDVTHHSCYRPPCSVSALQRHRSRFVESAPVE